MVMDYIPSLINDTYDIVLPRFRHDFHKDRPNWERGRLASCAELMKPGMVVYDIGAEHGDFTSLYRKWVEPDGDVIPIEPAAHYWRFIKDIWEANGFSPPPALTYCGLIGEKVQGFAGGLHLNKWCPHVLEEGIPDGGFVHLAQKPRLMPVATIDALARYVKPHAIVMDIEGAEFHALRGGELTFINDQPLVWVSVHEPTMKNWYRKTLDDLLGLMGSFGYDADELPHHGEGETFWLFTPR